MPRCILPYQKVMKKIDYINCIGMRKSVFLHENFLFFWGKVLHLHADIFQM